MVRANQIIKRVIFHYTAFGGFPLQNSLRKCRIASPKPWKIEKIFWQLRNLG
jgi:hypothetical protein